MTKFVRPLSILHAAQSGGLARRSALRQRTHRLRVGLLLLAAALLVSGCVLALPGGWGGVAGLVSALLALGLAACTSSGGGSGGGPDNIGFVVTGAADGDNAGRSVSWAGDVNDDGMGDLVIGAPDAGSYGEAYISLRPGQRGRRGYRRAGQLGWREPDRLTVRLRRRL